MLRLRIETHPARLGLDIRHPFVALTTTTPRAEVETRPPKLLIEIDWPSVEVDDRVSRAEIGLKGIGQRAREYAALGRQRALDGVRRRAREGDALASIEKGVRVAELTSKAAWPEDTREINVDLMPKSPVAIEAEGGLSVKAVPGDVALNLRQGRVKLDLRPGAVDVRLLQHASIEIEAVGSRFSIFG